MKYQLATLLMVVLSLINVYICFQVTKINKDTQRKIKAFTENKDPK